MGEVSQSDFLALCFREARLPARPIYYAYRPTLTGVLISDADGSEELEQALARIEWEHIRPEVMMPAAYEDAGPSFRSIESFLYRVSKVFQDKRPVGEQGQVMDRKMYVREVERKKELGLQ